MSCEQVPLIEFLLGELGSSETEHVLSHIEGCPTCRERLQTMAAVEGVYRDQHSSDQNIPRFWFVAAGLLIAVLVATFYPIWHRSSIDSLKTASLASEEKYPYFPLHTRSGSEGLETDIRERAFAAYSAEQFREASEWFIQLPPSADTLFYSAVTHYMLEEYPQALEQLAEAVKLDNQWKTVGLWYKANIYLKTEQKRPAQKALRDLVREGQNEYRQKALELLEKLETR
ncbi:MAG: zf-HC2 domain-containing protein [Acidobacteria bacterium]|nr:zf-HC2 domain-containing protein [Acidobacteriota bacterium]MCZ6768078.1 zf-HC2 domain-containing protein [Acidobacteriota bacterium]MCZ6877182.1 zf-HC2 domain-containing protein [Acidobacteriota bacterium]